MMRADDPKSLDDVTPRMGTLWTRLSTRPFAGLFLLALCFGSVLMAAVVVSNRYSSRHQHPFLLHELVTPYGRFRKVEDIRATLFSSIDPERMASTLETITEQPHQAGTEANKVVADMLVNLWRANGLEKVRLLEYDVLLSYPNWTTPNHATVVDESGQVLFQSSGLSPDMIPPDGGGDDYHAAIQWLAYSANGTVNSEPVYCHYGRPKDFERLEKEFGIANLHGRIAIIRYGEDFRGDKVKHAQARGAGGVIIFSDPVEVAGDGPDAVFPATDFLPSGGVQRGSVLNWNGDPLTPLLPARHDFHREKSIEQRTFPHSTWLPSGGVQRGTVMAMKGDPLTPLLPARPDFARGRSIQEAKAAHVLPSIPVLPMGYADVAQLLKQMGGPEVPADWQGGLPFPYHVGPGFNNGEGKKLRLDIQSKLEIKKIQNVVGIIRGQEEPDSWVLLGNHYDAWVYGALDPNSGTVILAEVARAFGEAVRKGWRPKRTLVFCAWDAEEHGLIGSTEFVQEFADLLRDRAVVYLNLDLISSNQSLDVRTVPSLYPAMTEAAKTVPNPSAEQRAQGLKTVYDSWRVHFPPQRTWMPDTPQMDIPGGGSDHMSFLNFLGIPVVDLTYRNASWKSYPLYHSRYEVPFVNEHLFDHDHLAVHKAVGQFWAELARAFADDPMLPINASVFAQTLAKDYLVNTQQAVKALHAKYPAETEVAVQQMASLIRQAQLFVQQASKFERVDSGLAGPEWTNRRLRKLDQCFINPSMGLAEKEPEKRHVLFSLSEDDTYSSSVMAAVNQKIVELDQAGEAEKRRAIAGQLALQLTVVQQAVLCATNTLKPFF